MSAEPIITIENLSKRYRLGRAPTHGSLRDALTARAREFFSRGRVSAERADDFWALRDVNFSIRQGEVVGIVGRNGAGKSTLLKILSRITEPTAGRITLRGRVASLLEVGTGFHGELSGRENIFLNGAILGMTRAEIRRKFDAIVAFAEVERFLDTPVKRYSSGMYVRLAFAVAAHLEPEILIIDEVLAVGDAAFQKKCLGKMREVAVGDGRTVLFVSHNLASVRQLCSRALLLEGGRLLADGTPTEVIARYAARTNELAARGGAYRHVRGDGSALIQRLRFHSAVQGEALYAIFETVTLDIEYEVAAERGGELEFFLLIYGEDGDCLAAIFQGDSGALTWPAARGSVSLSFKNPFSPGRYLVSAGIFDRSRQFLDWVEFAEAFQVEPSFATGRNFDQRLGRLTLLPEWKT
jgi:lipopolysaccharide transport system ATP-binding protein